MDESSFPILIPAFYLSAGLALYTVIHSFIFVSSKDRVSLNLTLALVSSLDLDYFVSPVLELLPATCCLRALIHDRVVQY